MGAKWRKYEAYLDSAHWRNLRATMPGNRECLVCASTLQLQLHHMFYPKNIRHTKHRHCCWLCDRCHKTFHEKCHWITKGEKKSWEWLRDKTKKAIEDALFPCMVIIPEREAWLEAMARDDR